MSLHFEADQSSSFVNFNLRYFSGLLAVKYCYSNPPPRSNPLHKAAPFLMLGSKLGFECGFCSEALAQHELARERAVPPSNQFLLFSQISPDVCRGFESGLASRWEIATSCYTNIVQYWKVISLLRHPTILIQRHIRSLNVLIFKFGKIAGATPDFKQSRVLVLYAEVLQ